MRRFTDIACHFSDSTATPPPRLLIGDSFSPAEARNKGEKLLPDQRGERSSAKTRMNEVILTKLKRDYELFSSLAPDLRSVLRFLSCGSRLGGRALANEPVQPCVPEKPGRTTRSRVTSPCLRRDGPTRSLVSFQSSSISISTARATNDYHDNQVWSEE